MTPEERETWEEGGWATWDTLVVHPVVLRMILHLGFTESAAKRWINHCDRIWRGSTLGEYLDKDDERLLNITNFGVMCLQITHAMRVEAIR